MRFSSFLGLDQPVTCQLAGPKTEALRLYRRRHEAESPIAATHVVSLQLTPQAGLRRRSPSRSSQEFRDWHLILRAAQRHTKGFWDSLGFL